ncbi:MAG: ABC transporter permease [Chloroflexota bacterium]|jgi:peptide/nickel transport system permease protein|nr:ABC transporter permease [Chloroflexota bacterium]
MLPDPGIPPASPGLAQETDEDAHAILAGSSARTWRVLRSDPSFWIGAAVVSILVLLAAAADLVAPYDPNLAIRGSGLTPAGDPVGPSAEFWLGTDRLGRDYLSRLLHGARTSLTVGIGANVIATLLGTIVGSLAAFVGTRSVGIGRSRLTISVEAILMRFTDVVLSLPALLLAIALVAVIGPSLLLVVIVIGGLLWTTTARIVYNRMRLLRELEFVVAARALGASNFRILWRHVLPHVVSLIVVYATLGIAGAVLFEAGLSFLGVGVPPPSASWGVMISEHASYFRTDPRLLALPGLAIMLTVLAFNLFGDALRDALDPHRWR